MDLPVKFEGFNNHLHHILEEKSMGNAGEDKELEGGSSDITVVVCVALGPSSLNGVTTTALDSGKVIGVQCLSKYCTHFQKGSTDSQSEVHT
jgi:hypothetical protein